MASVYMTKQGDTWDLMAYDLYGSEKYMRYLLEANWPLLDTLVFSSGTRVLVPEPAGGNGRGQAVLAYRRQRGRLLFTGGGGRR